MRLAMALLNMQCLLLLLLLPIGPAVTEVVKSMSDCADFFLQQTPPRIPGILKGGNIQNQNRYKAICQTLRDNRTFVTLYDTNNKIPVFSAGKYRGNEASRPGAIWKIEPQAQQRHRGQREADAPQHRKQNECERWLKRFRTPSSSTINEKNHSLTSLQTQQQL